MDGERPDVESSFVSVRPEALYGAPFLRLLAVQASFGVAFSTFYLVPKFVAVELSASPASIGVVTALYGVSGVVAIPVLGSGIDRVDRRIFLRAGGAVMVVAALGFLAVDRVGPLAPILRFLQGFAWTTVFSAGLALASDLAPRHRIAEAIGILGASNLVTQALAPAIAEPLADRVGYRTVFAIAAVAAAASLAWTASLPAPAVTTRHGLPPLRAFLSRPAIWGVAAVIAVAGMAFGVMFSFYQPFALARGIARVRSFFIAYSAGAFFVRVVLGRLVDRIGSRRVAVAALGLYTVAILGMRELTPFRLAAFAALFGVAHGFFFPSINALLLSVAGSRERGRALALSNGIFTGGSTCVFAIGYAVAYVGYPGVFGLTAMTSATAAVFLALWSPPASTGRA